MTQEPGDYLANVVPCECCRERWCLVHDMHWADCDCPGPHEEDPPDSRQGGPAGSCSEPPTESHPG